MKLLFSLLAVLFSFTAFTQSTDQILAKYLEAVGGEEKLRTLQSITYRGDVHALMQHFTYEIHQEYPNRRFISFYQNGVEVSSLVNDGENTYRVENGVQKGYSLNELRREQLESVFLPELYYREQNLALQYMGTKTLRKYNATYHRVKFSSPDGHYFINFYNTRTGLKERILYEDLSFDHFVEFQEIEGLKFPATFLNNILGAKSNATVTEVILNGQPQANLDKTAVYQEEEPDYRENNPEAKKEPTPISQQKPAPAATEKTLFSTGTSEGADAYSKKLALVIGNSHYQHTQVLKNPVNDARAISAKLQELGFDVLYRDNVSQREMKMAIDEFGKKLKGYDVGLFYYAGHGIQSKGKNYMIPVEAELSSEQQVEYDCIAADRVLAFMDYADSKVNIIMLDACRNNPFERSWHRSANGSGLAFMNAPTGSIIAYATSPGTTASDGEGENGLYTSAVLKHLGTPGLTIEQMFKRVRRDVEEGSSGSQVPWESTSLKGEFYFNKK